MSMSSWRDGDEGPWTDVQLICENGHQLTDSLKKYPQYRCKYCTSCGAPTLSNCPNCQSEIRGKTHYPRVSSIGYHEPIPHSCHSCGKKFPWADKLSSKRTAQPIEGIEPLIVGLINRFDSIQRQLQKRRKDSGASRATLSLHDEYDVQELLHALLYSIVDDVRTEEHPPSQAGVDSRIDFLIPDHELAIETKMTRNGLENSQLVSELGRDFITYGKHPNVKKLIVFVWDPEGRVKNPRGFEKDLTKPHGNLEVAVLVRPLR